jgi:hypothetical protein
MKGFNPENLSELFVYSDDAGQCLGTPGAETHPPKPTLTIDTSEGLVATPEPKPPEEEYRAPMIANPPAQTSQVFH